ncbi:MAG: AgmX/PglI C-terminal domain-containing protein [Polyangiaceae bacterium]
MGGWNGRAGLVTGVATAAAITLAGCGKSPSKREAPDERKEAPSGDPRVPDRPLDVRIRFEAVGMPSKISSPADFTVDKKVLAVALDTSRPALLACYSGRPLTPENADGPASTWVAMRVSDKGEVSGVRVARSNAPEASGKCASDVLGKIAYASQARSFALSVWLDVTPKEAVVASAPPTAAPVDSSAGPRKGPSAKANLPAGACDADNVLAYLPACAPDPSPASLFGRDPSLGPDPMSARGSLWGDADASGLGLSGAGGEGIGLGSIGAPGHAGGRLGSTHRPKPPQVRMGGTTVTGKLPPEVIQRIVRQSFGRFRLCYENGLRSDPALNGQVTVTFTIGTDGLTSGLSHTTTLADESVANCVERGFAGLSFPMPESGVVRVTYPINFSPGDDPAPKKVSAIFGVDLANLTGAGLATAATRDKTLATSVDGDPGSDVPFVVFVDVTGDHYAVVRIPHGASAPAGTGLYGEAFNVFVIRSGPSKATTAFLE